MFARATISYTPDQLDALAERVAEKWGQEVESSVLSRLGYVRVVRCRDCKHILRYHGVDPETGLPIGAEDWRCNHFKKREGPFEISPSGFCAWGERRADG